MDKMATVINLVSRELPHLTNRQIEEFVEADWPEGQEHLDWLDAASPTEIASWVITSLHNAEF